MRRRGRNSASSFPRALGCLFLLLLPLGVGAQEAPDSLQQHYEAAQTFQLAGDLDRAETHYRMVLAQALERLGNLRVAEGDYAEATRLLQAAVEAEPSYAEGRVALAIAYYRQDELRKAAAAVNMALRDHPNHVRATNLLGKIYFVQGDFEAAAQQLEKTLQLKPDFPTAYSLALAYLKLKKLPETMLLFDQLLDSMGSSPALHVLFGRAYRETDFYDQAITEFKKAIAEDPSYPRAHYYLGLTHLLQGGTQRFDQARKHFEAELETNPDHYLSRYYAGIIELAEHNYAAAETHLTRAVELRPDAPDPYFFLGQVYLDTGQPARAAELLKKSIALTSDFRHNNYQVTRAHYLLGRALLKLGQRDQAQEHLARSQELRARALRSDQQALQQPSVPAERAAGPLPPLEKSQEVVLPQESLLDPEELKRVEGYRAQVAKILGHSYHNLGVIHARREHFPQAADYFRLAARWNPDLQGLDRHWGLASFRAGRYGEAIGPLERRLEVSPEDTVVRRLLGLSYFMNDDYEKAVQVLRPFLADLPDEPGLLYALGTSLVRSGSVERGSEVFARLLEQNQRVAEIHVILGQAHAQQHNYTKALDELALALQLNPKVPQAHYYSGLIDLRQGRLPEAEAHFRAEIALQPNNSVAKYHLAYVLLRQQRNQEAIPLLQELVREQPDYADAHYQLGKALLQQGEVDEAIARLETAVRLDPEQEYSHYQLSLAYRKKGRVEDAERALRVYRELKEKNRRGQEP